jgi:hypothetical protein
MPTSIAWPRVSFMKEYWIRIVTRNVEHQLELIDLTNFCFDASLIFSQFLRFWLRFLRVPQPNFRKNYRYL